MAKHRAHVWTPKRHRASRFLPTTPAWMAPEQSTWPSKTFTASLLGFLLLLAVCALGTSVVPVDPPQVVQAAVVADVVCPVVLR